MNGDNELVGTGSSEPERHRVALIIPRPKPSRFVLTKVVLKRARQTLLLPIAAVVAGVLPVAFDLGIDWVLGAFGVQFGLVLVIKPLLKVLAKSIPEERRIRRIRKCVGKDPITNDRYSRETLQKLKLCPGSGRSIRNRQDWRDDKCQHCFQSPDATDNRIDSHLLHQVYVGMQPVECDPRLIPALLRGFGRGQEQ